MHEDSGVLHGVALADVDQGQPGDRYVVGPDFENGSDFLTINHSPGLTGQGQRPVNDQTVLPVDTTSNQDIVAGIRPLDRLADRIELAVD